MICQGQFDNYPDDNFIRQFRVTLRQPGLLCCRGGSHLLSWAVRKVRTGFYLTRTREAP